MVYLLASLSGHRKKDETTSGHAGVPFSSFSLSGLYFNQHFDKWVCLKMLGIFPMK